jgi:hypothetical protein
MDNHALVATWLCCCTPLLVQIGYPSTDACAGDSSCASTRGCIPSVSVSVTAQTDLVVLMGLGVLAMFPVVQPEPALQRLRHTWILRPVGCCGKVPYATGRATYYERGQSSTVADGWCRLTLAMPDSPRLVTTDDGRSRARQGTPPPP